MEAETEQIIVNIREILVQAEKAFPKNDDEGIRLLEEAKLLVPSLRFENDKMSVRN